MQDDAVRKSDAGTLVAAPAIHCIECVRPWLHASERWQLKLLEEADGTETVPYCPDCAAREFGPF